jgi:membrane fusion protein, multidrug efflux system
VATATAQLAVASEVRSLVGWVEPLAAVKVRARVQGEIVERLVQDGSNVKEGDLLFQIADGELQAELARQKAALARDLATLDRLERELSRANELKALNIASQTKVDLTASERGVAAANVAASRAALRSAEINLSYATVKAPITGRVGMVRAARGDFVGPAEPGGLLTITQMKPLHVALALPERDLGALREALAHPGNPPLMRIFVDTSNQPIAFGQIAAVESSVEKATGTIPLRVLTKNDDEALWPGQYVRVDMEFGKRQVVTVPSSAVRRNAHGATVFAVGADGKVALRSVRLGQDMTDLAAVTFGLSVGDRVVLNAAASLRDGTEVETAAPVSRVSAVEAHRAP